MDENNNTLELKIYLQDKGYDDYDVEELIEDYIPRVKEHIGFCDNRRDSRFVVKFHDIFYFHEAEDMPEEQFNMLFELFCEEQYQITQEIIKEDCSLTERQLLTTHDVGHYRTFEVIISEPISEENYVDWAIKIYEEGLSPAYIDDYVKIANHLQDMEANYMEYWIEFLEANDIPDTTIKKIKERVAEYEKTHGIEL